MKKISFLTLTILLALVSCKKSNLEEMPPITQGTPFSMVIASGGIAGNKFVIPKGEVTWDLDVNTLKVVNNSNQNIPTALASGNYNFKFQTINKVDYIIIDNIPEKWIVEKNTSDCLVLDDGNADGFSYTFVK
jgi:hypothetical protein